MTARITTSMMMEAAIAANLARSERLRQSILKRAFEGKLVPQDASDEPANMLLERIRAGGVVARRAGASAIRRYIQENPLRWNEDRDNPDNTRKLPPPTRIEEYLEDIQALMPE